MREMTLSHLTLGATPLEAIAAASEVGFRSVGIRLCGRRFQEPYPVAVIGVPAAIRAIRRALDDTGVRLANVNAFQFFPDVTWDRLAPVVDTAAELRAPIILANSFDDDEERFVASYTRFCEAAQPAGIRIALEFLPYSRVRTLADALRVVERSGCANAGVLIDALHLDRSGGTPDDVRRVAPERIVFAQMCDAKRLAAPISDEEMMRQARSARLELGEGDLPLYDFVDALPASLELEYEVINAEIAHFSPKEKARVARLDAERFIDGYCAYRARRAEAASAGAR